MNILNELTVKNLRQNKKRTIVTIFGILLSVALVTAITTFVSSMQKSMVDRSIQNYGNYHIFVSDIPAEEQKQFLQYEKAEKVMKGQSLGEIAPEEIVTASYEEMEMESMEIRLRSFDAEAFEEMGIRLAEGRLPENEREIVLPVWLDASIGVECGVGDTLSLTVQGEKRDYTVVGIAGLTSFEFRMPDGSLGYTLLTKLDHDTEGENIDVALLFKNPKEVYPFAEELKNERGYGEGQISTNDSLLRSQMVTRSDSLMLTFYTIAAIVIFIIVFTSVFVIKNSFDISITERMKQYGMLASIGATSKQIRKNVLFEGLLLGIAAVPLGILCGIFAIWATLLVVMEILKDMGIAEDFPLNLHVSVWAVVAAVLVAGVTIFISALIPAVKASKVSPVEAIRESTQIQLKGKRLRTSKVIQKLFGIEGEIADKNLKRSRKKYRTTVFSIFLSVVLFVSITSVMQYIISRNPE